MVVKGISMKGKNRVREHGDRWVVIATWPHVKCLRDQPGFLLKSVKTGWFRWVAKDGDTDFEVVNES